jgi:hypothetical protein
MALPFGSLTSASSSRRPQSCCHFLPSPSWPRALRSARGRSARSRCGCPKVRGRCQRRCCGEADRGLRGQSGSLRCARGRGGSAREPGHPTPKGAPVQAPGSWPSMTGASVPRTDLSPHPWVYKWPSGKTLAYNGKAVAASNVGDRTSLLTGQTCSCHLVTSSSGVTGRCRAILVALDSQRAEAPVARLQSRPGCSQGPSFLRRHEAAGVRFPVGPGLISAASAQINVLTALPRRQTRPPRE